MDGSTLNNISRDHLTTEQNLRSDNTEANKTFKKQQLSMGLRNRPLVNSFSRNEVAKNQDGYEQSFAGT